MEKRQSSRLPYQLFITFLTEKQWKQQKLNSPSVCDNKIDNARVAV